MTKYVTRRLAIGDVVKKDGSTYYVLNRYEQRQFKKDGSYVMVDCYVLTSDTVQTETSVSATNMDGRGWVVTNVLTEEGYKKACANPTSVTINDYLELEWKFLYDSKLCDKVSMIQKLEVDSEEASSEGAACNIQLDTIIDILCG